MANPQNVRVSDRSDYLDLKQSGFIVRKRTPAAQIGRLLAMLVIVVMGVAVLVYYNALTGCFMCVGVGLVILYVALQLEKAQKIQQATEFLNALFSSALGKNFEFCMISRRDGEIIYLNRAFQALFPTFMEQPKRNLDTLFSTYQVSEEHRSAVESLLTKENEGTANIIVRKNGDDKPQPLTFTVAPIERPHGYVLIRGK